ncbi:hypothetical protein FJT64_008720 [Amphibalanus amphitrite]|uniref:Potassium channel domain-containing protein n=1 Tax=Amphibalanus amphitrite TaxID=1232801 RepID=A0A6A4VRX6_AMPAM|nr:hypothetical protein FJT64_008720 [Amphibalanus amphitrite]
MAGSAENRVTASSESGPLAPLTREMSSDSVDKSSRTVDGSPSGRAAPPRLENGLGDTAPVPPARRRDLSAAVTHGAEPRAELATSETLRRRLEALDEELRHGFVVPAVVPPLLLGSAAATPASSRATTPRQVGRSASGRAARRVHFASEEPRQAGTTRRRRKALDEVEGQVPSSGGAQPDGRADPELGREQRLGHRVGSGSVRPDPELGREQRLGHRVGSGSVRPDPELGQELRLGPRVGSGVGRELLSAAEQRLAVTAAPPRRAVSRAVSRAVQTLGREPRFTWFPSVRGLRGGRASRLRRAVLRSWLCQLAALACWLLAAAALLLLAEAPAQRRARRQLGVRRAELVVELATELRQVVPHQAVWRHKIAHYMGRLEQAVLAASEAGLPDGGGDWTYGAALYTVTAASVSLGPGWPAARSPLGAAVLAVTVAVALPLAVSLAATLVYLLRRHLARWAAAGRCCRRRPAGAQVHPLPPAVYTVPAHNGHPPAANGVPRTGQGHRDAANQNGRADRGKKTPRQRPMEAELPQNGPLVLKGEAEDHGPPSSPGAGGAPENGPVVLRAVRSTSATRSLAPDYHERDENGSAIGSTSLQKDPPQPEERPYPADRDAGRGSCLPAAAALALYVACGALVLGVSRRLDAGSALLTAVLAVTGGQVPVLAGPAAAAVLLYAVGGMVITATLCVRVFAAVRAAAVEGP